LTRGKASQVQNNLACSKRKKKSEQRRAREGGLQHSIRRFSRKKRIRALSRNSKTNKMKLSLLGGVGFVVRKSNRLRSPDCEKKKKGNRTMGVVTSESLGTTGFRTIILRRGGRNLGRFQPPKMPFRAGQVAGKRGGSVNRREEKSGTVGKEAQG